MQLEKPCRVEHTYKQLLDAKPRSVFPLLCPVREIEWAEGWSPLLVISTSGVAEKSCIFTTTEDGRESVWVITRYDPESGVVAFVKVTPGFIVTELEIQLHEVGERQTKAVVTYRYTSLSEAGKTYLAARTSDWYIEFMKNWESELNSYLRGSGEDR